MNEFILGFKLTNEVGARNSKNFKKEISNVRNRISLLELELEQKQKQRDELIKHYTENEKLILQSKVSEETKKELLKKNTNKCIHANLNTLATSNRKEIKSLKKLDIEKNANMHRIMMEFKNDHNDCKVISNNGYCIFCGKKVKDARVKLTINISDQLLRSCIEHYLDITKEEKDFDEFMKVLETLK